MTDFQPGKLSASPDRESPRPAHCLQTVIRGIMKRVALWSLAFVVVDLLGFRAYTSILSGTSSFGVPQRIFGAFYLLLYAGVVVAVPILLIAAALLKGATRIPCLWGQADERGSLPEQEPP